MMTMSTTAATQIENQQLLLIPILSFSDPAPNSHKNTNHSNNTNTNTNNNNNNNNTNTSSSVVVEDTNDSINTATADTIIIDDKETIATKRKHLPLPYIVLPSTSTSVQKTTAPPRPLSSSSSTTAMTIGRVNLIYAMSSACQCLSLVKEKKRKEQQTGMNRKRMKNHQESYYHHRPTCASCQYIESWMKKYISKQMIQIKKCATTTPNTATVIGEKVEEWIVKGIGQHSKYIIQIIIDASNIPKHHQQPQPKYVKMNQEYKIRRKSIIRFINPEKLQKKRQEKKPVQSLNNDHECSGASSSSSSSSPLSSSSSSSFVISSDAVTTKQSNESIQKQHQHQHQHHRHNHLDQIDFIVDYLHALATPPPTNQHHKRKQHGGDDDDVDNDDKIPSFDSSSPLKKVKLDATTTTAMVKLACKSKQQEELSTVSVANVKQDNNAQIRISEDFIGALDQHTRNDNAKEDLVEEEEVFLFDSKKDKNESPSKALEIINLLSSPESSPPPPSSVDQSKTAMDEKAIVEQKKTTQSLAKHHSEGKVSSTCTLHNESNTTTTTATTTTNDGSNQTHRTHHHISVHFIHRGRSMSQSRIGFLKQNLVRKANEEKKKISNLQLDIIMEYCPLQMKMPMYFIVDNTLSLEVVSSYLGFSSEKMMVAEYEKNPQTYFVAPEWVIHTTSIVDKPSMDHTWVSIFKLKQMMKSNKDNDVYEKKGNQGNSNKNRWIERNRRLDEFAPVTNVKASETDNEMIACLNKLRQPTEPKGKNSELSELFGKISKLYKEMPVQEYDEWRSYSYNAASARLKYLDFPMINDEESLKRLSKRKGFGQKFMRQIKEYLTTGKCQLVFEFEHDPMRVNVRNMIKIWGIGSRKAVELVNLGYTDIDSVRRALDENKLDLYDNARVGVQFYEDFLEKMTRNEVKLIGDIVAAAGRKYFPEAEITTMGSYRRGSEKCGDVDVLITHRKFSKCIPKGAMDELVERLRDEGHISHHLTKVDTIHKRTLPMRVGNLDDILMNTSKKAASYMGVFISPTVPGKHRRIDIKFYPYQQKPSATLYFTGNGWFNRAMRWYAKQKKGMKLDDTGLFILTKNEEKKMGFEGKRLKVKSEKEIFDHLHLVYKEPHERDCFDAVVPKSDQDFGFDMNPNHSDFEPETRLSWVE